MKTITTITQARNSRANVKRKAFEELAELEKQALKFLKETPDTGVYGIPYKTNLS